MPANPSGGFVASLPRFDYVDAIAAILSGGMGIA
jgi:hypothetical protein